MPMWQLDLYGFRPILSDTFVIFGSVYYAHTEESLWFGRVVECRLLRSRVQTYVRQYASSASEIAVSSIGSEPSERSRKGRRLKGEWDLERGQPLEELRRLGGCGLEPRWAVAILL